MNLEGRCPRVRPGCSLATSIAFLILHPPAVVLTLSQGSVFFTGGKPSLFLVRRSYIIFHRSGHIPDPSVKTKNFLCSQERRGPGSCPRPFSLLTDHKLVIFVTFLQLLACHLHCLKSKQNHLNLQAQYFSPHTSPVTPESQLCVLFCQCAGSRRETSLLF